MDQKNDFYHWRYTALSQSTSQHEFVENLIKELGHQRKSLNLVAKAISAYSERDSSSFTPRGFSTELDKILQIPYNEEPDGFLQIPYNDDSVAIRLTELIVLIETIRLQDEENISNSLQFSIKNKHLQNDISEILKDSHSLLNVLGTGSTRVESFRRDIRGVDSKIQRLSRDLLRVQNIEKNSEREKSLENLSGAVALPSLQRRPAVSVRSPDSRKPLSILNFSPQRLSDRAYILIVLGSIAGIVVVIGESLRPEAIFDFHPLLQGVSGSNLWQRYLSPVLLGVVIALSVSVIKTLFSVMLLLLSPTQQEKIRGDHSER